VLLHGVGESAVGWRPVQDALSRDYDVIALDFPGFGGSAKLPAHEKRKLNSIICCPGVPVAGELSTTPITRTRRHCTVHGGTTAAITVQVQ
jgi:pimeloyl-ACP methyl ester carboxylesterase